MANTMTMEQFELAVYDSWEAQYHDALAMDNQDIDGIIHDDAATLDIDEHIAEINELNAITDPRAFK